MAGIARRKRRFSDATATEGARLLFYETESLKTLVPCSLNPCNGTDSCVFFNEKIHCSCANGLGYVQVGQMTCQSLSPVLDAGDVKEEGNNYFINVNSSMDLCEPNPCGERVECVPFNQPHCRCHHSKAYVPFGQPCPNMSAAANVGLHTSNSPHQQDVTTEPGSTYSIHSAWNILIAVVGMSILFGILFWPATRTDQKYDGKEKRWLFSQDKKNDSGRDEDYGEGEEYDWDPCSEDDEARMSDQQYLIDISKIAGFVGFSEIFQTALPVINIAFVAHLGTEELGATGLATAWFNLLNAMMLGGMTVIDTVLAQCSGANDRVAFRSSTGNSLVGVAIATAIFSVMMALCGPAMRLIGQDPKLADMAGHFSYRLIPGLFPYYACRALMKFLQTQDILMPGLAIGPFAAGFNILFNWLLIFEFDMGFDGAPWATTATRFAEFFLLFGYMLWNKHTVLESTWPSVSISKETTFNDIRHYLSMCMAAAVGTAAAFWGFAITAFLAGYLGTIELDAYAIAHSVAATVYASISIPIQIAVSIRVGQLVGAGSVTGAQRSGTLAFGLALVIQTILASLILLFKDEACQLLTSDPEVAALVASLIPVYCVLMMSDAVETVAMGILRGLGQQKQFLTFSIVGYWVVGLPLGCILAFVVGIGVAGLMWGLTIAAYTVAMLGVIFLKFRVDWTMEKRKGEERVASISRSASGAGDCNPDMRPAEKIVQL